MKVYEIIKIIPVPLYLCRIFMEKFIVNSHLPCYNKALLDDYKF